MLPHHLDNVPPPRLLYECFLRQHFALQEWFSLQMMPGFQICTKYHSLCGKTTLSEDQSTWLFAISIHTYILVLLECLS